MAGDRFSVEDWDKGADAPESLGVVESILGVVPAEAPSLERDRHFVRHNRQKVKARKGDRLKTLLQKPERVINRAIVETSKFVNSRLTRLPLADKRRQVDSFAQTDGLALVAEHREVSVEARLDALRRHQDLADVARVDDLSRSE